MSSNGPSLRSQDEALRAGVTWWLALALVLAMAHLVHTPASGPAEEPCFLFLRPQAGRHWPGPATTLPKDHRPCSTTPPTGHDLGQAAALRRLEEQAVNAVLKVHDLPESDAIDVRYWARTRRLDCCRNWSSGRVSTRQTERTLTRGRSPPGSPGW